jgi:hypothetical protein
MNIFHWNLDENNSNPLMKIYNMLLVFSLFIFYRCTLLALAVADHKFYTVLFYFLSTGPHVSLFRQAGSQSLSHCTVIPFHWFSDNGTTAPRERWRSAISRCRGPGTFWTWDASRCGFPLPTRANPTWSASLPNEKIPPRSVINVLSTVRLDTESGFRL